MDAKESKGTVNKPYFMSRRLSKQLVSQRQSQNYGNDVKIQQVDMDTFE